MRDKPSHPAIVADPGILIWLALSLFPEFNRLDFNKIVDHPSWQDLQDDPLGFCREEVALSSQGQQWFKTFKNWQSLKVAVSRCHSQGTRILCWPDTSYPARLRQIHSPPPVIFYRGFLPFAGALPTLAVVGSRRMTPYGARLIRQLLPELVRAGVDIVSGLAVGVDGMAHKVCLENGGRTLGVLGCGLEVDYPSQHTALKKEMAKTGAILSEFFPETTPLPANFLRRNRLIAGLADAVWVVEAGSRSGSLNTAHHALEQGKEILASPGSVFSGQSDGCHDLIAQGARLVQNAADILQTLHVPSDPGNKNQSTAKLDSPAREILRNLSASALSLDELIMLKPQCDRQQLVTLLAEIEVRGLVSKDGCGRYYAC